MKKYPLMPKATAVWLVQNTSLTFKQIADFCGLHELEVSGIARGEIVNSISGIDPVRNYQLTQEEIDKCEKNPNQSLKLMESPALKYLVKKQKSKYTPITKRKDRPDAIMWILKTHPEFSDKDISKLLGTTKKMIESIRDKTHWNIKEVKPRDPVILGICSQKELNIVIEKHSSDKSKG